MSIISFPLRICVGPRLFMPLLSLRPPPVILSASFGSLPGERADPKLALRMTAVRKFTPMGECVPYPILGRDQLGPYARFIANGRLNRMHVPCPGLLSA